MAEVARGEIWLYSFPKPDKRRPALVLTRQDMIGRLHTVTIAPVTSTIHGVPSEVVIGPESGLKARSAINLHHVVTVPRRGLTTYVGTVSAEMLEHVQAALLFALGFGGAGAPQRSVLREEPPEYGSKGRARAVRAPSAARPRNRAPS